jgi:hypothetical protein
MLWLNMQKVLGIFAVAEINTLTKKRRITCVESSAIASVQVARLGVEGESTFFRRPNQRKFKLKHSGKKNHVLEAVPASELVVFGRAECCVSMAFGPGASMQAAER